MIFTSGGLKKDLLHPSQRNEKGLSFNLNGMPSPCIHQFSTVFAEYISEILLKENKLSLYYYSIYKNKMEFPQILSIFEIVSNSHLNYDSLKV
jgi:hypothetical protein